MNVVKLDSFLEKSDICYFYRTTIYRSLLAFMDLAGLFFISLSISLLSGAVIDEKSPTSYILNQFDELGVKHPLAVFALISILFFGIRAFTSLLLNKRIARKFAKLESDRSTALFEKALGSNLETFNLISDSALSLALVNSSQMLFRIYPVNLSILISEIGLIILLSLFLIKLNFGMFLIFAAYLALVALLLDRLILARSTKLARLHQSSWLSATEVSSSISRLMRATAGSSAGGFFLQKFSVNRQAFSNSSADLANLSISPRHLVEFALMLGISLLVLQKSFSSPLDLVEPSTIAIFVAASFKVVASLVTMQGSFAQTRQGLEQGKLFLESEKLIELSNSDLFNKLTSDAPENSHLQTHPAVEIRNLSYSYPNDPKKVIDNLSFQIGKLEFVALIGESGQGKSTIADLILGLRSPTLGFVNVFGDSAESSRARNKGLVGYMSQETYIFQGTLLENITLSSRGEFDPNRLESALFKANLSEVVSNLPDGLETRIGNGIRELSGGQKQRVGLARALYQDSEILILDEPTAALDASAKEEIRLCLERLGGSKTVLMISHDPELVNLASRKINL